MDEVSVVANGVHDEAVVVANGVSHRSTETNAVPVVKSNSKTVNVRHLKIVVKREVKTAT